MKSVAPTISVVVPVFNKAGTLEQLISNFRSITNLSWEAILVDDGSSDDSRAICFEAARDDHRITALHQENGGPSKARNAGLAIARGRYVVFVDADDQVVQEGLIRGVTTAERDGADLVICAYEDQGRGKRVQLVGLEDDGVVQSGLSSRELFDLYVGGLLNPVWNKVYRRAFLEASHIRFESDVDLGEDLLFNLDVLDASPSVGFCRSASYRYIRQPPGSSLITKPRQERLITHARLHHRLEAASLRSGADEGQLRMLRVTRVEELVRIELPELARTMPLRKGPMLRKAWDAALAALHDESLLDARHSGYSLVERRALAGAPGLLHIQARALRLVKGMLSWLKGHR